MYFFFYLNFFFFRDAINKCYFLNNDILGTGDDNGEIRIWDLRTPNKSIFDGNN